MCEITIFNLEEKYDEIVENVKNASFLAIDFEFSGLGSTSRSISLFDDPWERYEKMRAALKHIIVLQMGISAYEYDRGQNYKVANYVFYMFPRSYPYSPERFSCDSRSLQFLSVQNFDFNKAFRDGLTHVCLVHEREIEELIKSGKMISKLKGELSYEDKRSCEDICRGVYDWALQSRATGTKVVDLTDLDPLRRFLVRDHIETQFKVRTVYTEKFKLQVERGTRTEEEKRDEVFKLVMGVSSLVKEIVSMKKPIVGHNMFMDLMMFYKTFWGPLPSEYSKFKKEIVKIFPAMYDTKLLAFEMKRMVGRDHLDTPFNLVRLFDYFNANEDTSFHEMPVVELKPNFELVAHVHDSGYDAFCTGFVFLQLAHMFSLWDSDRRAISNFSIGNSPACYFRVTEPFKNRVNMMRGKMGHFNLGGRDPVVEKPNLLMVEVTKGRTMDHHELTKLIAKHDSADLRPLGPNQVLIASSSDKKLKEIEFSIINSGHYQVVKYNPKCNNTFEGKHVYIALGAVSAAAAILYFFYYGRKN